MTLLSKYYREHPDRFTEFVIEATHSHRRMYLFDMVRYVHTYVCTDMHSVEVFYFSELLFLCCGRYFLSPVLCNILSFYFHNHVFDLHKKNSLLLPCFVSYESIKN